MQESCDKSQCKKYYVIAAAVIVIAIAGFAMYYINASSVASESDVSQTSDVSANDDASSEEKDGEENDSANVSDANTQNIALDEGFYYENTDYGFQIHLPESWSETFTVKENKITLGEFGSANAVYFGLPGDEELFAISMYSKEQWEKIKSEEGPMPDYLGENEKYVFGFNTAQDASLDTLIQEAQLVAKTFKLLQD